MIGATRLTKTAKTYPKGRLSIELTEFDVYRNHHFPDHNSTEFDAILITGSRTSLCLVIAKELDSLRHERLIATKET